MACFRTDARAVGLRSRSDRRCGMAMGARVRRPTGASCRRDAAREVEVPGF